MLLPAPGGPVRPTSVARPLSAKVARTTSAAPDSSFSYQVQRFASFLAGSSGEPSGTGWAVHQAQIALASGSLLGRAGQPAPPAPLDPLGEPVAQIDEQDRADRQHDEPGEAAQGRGAREEERGHRRGHQQREHAHAESHTPSVEKHPRERQEDWAPPGL